MALDGIRATSFIPLVNSKIPDKTGAQNCCETEKQWNKGLKKLEQYCKMPLCFKMEIITEKRTTKPPIKTIV